jgi:hypothetical protein
MNRLDQMNAAEMSRAIDRFLTRFVIAELRPAARAELLGIIEETGKQAMRMTVDAASDVLQEQFNNGQIFPAGRIN